MLFEVFVNADDGCPLLHPTYNNAANALAWFTMSHKGLYHGPENASDPSTLIVDLSEEFAELLQEADYVERLPVPGAIHRGVFPYTGPKVPEPDILEFSFGGTD